MAARRARSARLVIVRTRVGVVCVLLAFRLIAGDAPASWEDTSAWETYERGREAEKAGHMADAYLLYSQASAMDPKNQTYWLRSQAVRSRAALEAKVMPKLNFEADSTDSEDAPTFEE